MSKFPLDIYIVVPGMAFDGDTIKKQSLGGSETAGLYVARELAKRGHYLTVFANLPEGPKKIDGVVYAPLSMAAATVTRSPHDILIGQRVPEIFFNRTTSKQNYLWNHDLAMRAAAGKLQAAAWNLDGVFLLSDFHVEQHLENYPFLTRDFCIKTRNGIDPEAFAPFEKMKKDSKKLFYSARPERGLENLVRPGGIMERLLNVDPSLRLYVAGYDNTVPEMRAFYELLWSRCRELPNVELLGPLTKADLYRHMAEASLYVYPTDFEEISCISAMEAMKSGTPIVTTAKLGALPETIGEKCGVYIHGPANSTAYFDLFTKTVVDLLHSESKLARMSSECVLRARRFGWAGVAEQWEDLFFSRFADATKDKRKVFDHFVYHDDIVFAHDFAEKEGMRDDAKDLEDRYPWAFSCDGQYAEKYANYQAKELIGYDVTRAAKIHVDDFERGGSIGLRWTVVREWLSRNLKPGAKVLDYGCGPGHFACAMARMGLQVVAVDISQANLKATDALADELKIPAESVVTADQSNIDAYKDKYDTIFLGDVLEHVQDPRILLQILELLLAEGGRFLLTTPIGPTRAGASKRSGFRHEMHLRHYEAADLFDLFGKKPGFSASSFYWQHAQTTGEFLGWFLTEFGPGGRYGKINYSRKALVQAPRERLSACLIVKNEENCLRRCLASIHDVSDEIIICDTGSTDGTKAIAADFGALIIDGPDPIAHGFEAARNASIAPARGDWILWVDADEIVENAASINKYLRRALYDGLRLRQHHFSCQPPGAAKIDKPVRIFRRGIARFYGIVHEHPEKALNESVEPSFELPDVDISHTGYHTDIVRRGKFNRNLQLLMKDRDKYPTRILGRFLYLRDLVQLTHAELEQNGNQMTSRTKKYCEEALQIYRNFFLSLGGHTAADGLPFYSRALELLGRGRNYTWSANVGSGPEPPRQARFENTEDFLAFIKQDIDGKSWPFIGPYGVKT